MSEDYKINLHLDTKASIFGTMLETHGILSRHGIKITGDSEILLFDYMDEGDFDFEPIKDLHKALKKLAAWPALGTVSYWLEDREISVAYSKEIENTSIQCISIFFADRFFEDEKGGGYLPILLNLVADLHQGLRSTRTIWGWGLDAWLGYDWTEEIQRLSKKKVEGLYWLDILREDYVSGERENFLSRHRPQGSILKYLSDRSLYYQQTNTPSSWFREGRGERKGQIP
jgi:hypothetical protein